MNNTFDSHKIHYTKFLPVVFILLAVFLFCLRLFFPDPSFFTLPNNYQNPMLQTDLPSKYFLSDSLQKKVWPLWNPSINGGIPFLAQNQIGTFYIPNLLFFRILPFAYAYNLNIFITFLLAGFGTYLFLRILKFSYSAGIFGSFVFIFSGYWVTHLNYLNILESVSLIPIIVCSLYFLYRKPKLINALLLAFLLSQQIFTGYFFGSFITISGIIISLIGLFFFDKKKFFQLQKSKLAILIILSILWSLFLSLIQILPTIELMITSGRITGLDFNAATSYPFPVKQILTVINPFILGNPIIGTYPQISPDWGIFTENTFYIGILPLLFSFLSLIYVREKPVKIGLLLLSLSFLLVLGKNSPFYFIFSFPGFNLFQIPSRYLVLSVFLLIFLSTFMFEKLINKLSSFKKNRSLNYLFIITVFSILFIDNYRFAFNFPIVSPAIKYITFLKSAKLITTQDEKIADLRSLTFGSSDFLIPKRLLYMNTFMNDFQVDDKKEIASLSALSKNILSLSSVDFVISPYKLNAGQFLMQKEADSSLTDYYIYKTNEKLPRSFQTAKTQKIITVEDAQRIFSNDKFLDSPNVLVENPVDFKYEATVAEDKSTITYLSDTEIIVHTESKGDRILTLRDTYYPGWKATVDGNPAEIIPVNIYQRGVFTKSGRHTVKFTYQPQSFEAGKILTVIFTLITFLAVFLSRAFSPRIISDKRETFPCL